LEPFSTAWIDGRHELVPGPVVYMPLGRSKDN
jgi:hypothetical protein